MSNPISPIFENQGSVWMAGIEMMEIKLESENGNLHIS